MTRIIQKSERGKIREGIEKEDWREGRLERRKIGEKEDWREGRLERRKIGEKEG
jgi:hypothetical protein